LRYIGKANIFENNYYINKTFFHGIKYIYFELRYFFIDFIDEDNVCCIDYIEKEILGGEWGEPTEKH